MKHQFTRRTLLPLGALLLSAAAAGGWWWWQQRPVTVAVGMDLPLVSGAAVDLYLQEHPRSRIRLLTQFNKPEPDSGLGLFVVRTTLTNHHGSLQISRSSSLGGAEVSMRLPLAAAHNYQESVMPEGAQAP